MSLGAVMISWALTSPAPAPETTACAEAHVDADIDAASDDDLLNAALCADANEQPAIARTLLERLLVEYPASRHWLEAAHRLVLLNQTRADFRLVATHLERIARRFPKDARSPDALLEAAYLWTELGERTYAEHALLLFERSYRRKNPDRADAVAWARVELAEDDDERLERARAFSRRSFERPSMDRRVVAEAMIGRILWDRSCPSPGPDGECFRTVSAGDTPCRIESRTGLEVRRRRARVARRAQEHFATALRLARTKSETPEPGTRRGEAYADAIGQATVLSIDADFEALVAAPAPHFRRNATWKDDREVTDGLLRSMASLIERYAEIRPHRGSMAWHLVAAQRVGRLTDHTAHRIAHLALARHPPSAARCRTLTKEHAALVKQSTDAYRYCLDRSIDAQYFGDASARCEAVMQVRDPVFAPRNDELRGAPAPGVMPPRAAGVILDVDIAWETGTRLLDTTADHGEPTTTTSAPG